MQYVFLIHDDETQQHIGSPERLAAYGKFSEEVEKRGMMRGGARLRTTSAATTVRVRDGKTMLTDGPFAETKEQLGGFYILDCKDLDEAIAYAAKIPSADGGSIEVRPIWEMGE
jgi:hypothetical protein